MDFRKIGFFMFVGILMLIVTGTGLAKVIVQPERETTRPPQVVIPKNSSDKPIELRDLVIETVIYGNVAVTTYDMTFHNPNGRVMEGELEFPLGEGQRVVGYSLDVNGTQRPGVVTEKELARKAYEEKVRQGVDPGIIEKTAGNNYKTRIYPFMPNGVRRITITYEETLGMGKAGYEYGLPLSFEKPVAKFSYQVKISQLNQAPSFIEAIDDLTFTDGGSQGYYAKVEKTNYTPNRNVKVKVPPSMGNQSFHEELGGEHFALVHVNLEQERAGLGYKSKPAKVAILWDSSLSSRDSRDKVKETQLLDGYLTSLGISEVDVYTFDATFLKHGSYKTSEISSTLFYTSIPELGGTEFGQIDWAVLNGYDEVLVLSDGLNNLGNPMVRDQVKTRVLAIGSGNQSNESYLRYLSGGNYIPLTYQSIDQAMLDMKREKLQLLRIVPLSGVEEVYQDSYRGDSNELSLALRMTGKTGRVRLEFLKGDQVISKEVAIDMGDLPNQKGISRIFGGKKVSNLELQSEMNRKEIVETAKKYSIVTDFTSLIVLEDIQDYVKFEIVPPEELGSQYDQLVAQKRATVEEQQKNRLIYLAGQMDQMKKWYETDYPLVPVKVEKVKNHPENNWAVPVSREVRREMPQATLATGVTTSVPSMDAEFVNKKEGAGATGGRTIEAKIKLKEWTPDEPYIQEIEKYMPASYERKFFDLQKEYGTTPSFYLDMSDFFLKKGDKKFANRILLSLMDFSLEDHEVLRALAYKLIELGDYERAQEIFKRILLIRGEDQQSYRDMGLAYEKMGDPQKSLDFLYQGVSGLHARSHPGVDQTLLMEINRQISRYPNLDQSKIDSRLIYPMPMDVRVVIEWNYDSSDIDLWVTDPNKERIYYGNKLSQIGGRITADVTTGFGPEEFTLKKAVKGNYQIQVNYYGSREQKFRLQGAPMIKATIFTNYGRPTEEGQDMMIRINDKRGTVDIGEFEY